MPTVATNGITLYYEQQGEGDPLVFVAGLGGNSRVWAPAVAALSKRHRCIVFDNRGAGRSDAPPGPYTVEEMADDTAEMLGSLGVGTADFVGVSLGGCIAQALGYRRPDLVRRAVLISTFPGYTELQHAWIEANLARLGAGVDRLAGFISGAPWIYTPRMMANHHEFMRLARIMTGDGSEGPGRGDGYIGQVAAARTFDSRPRLHEITAETLVLVGAEDILTPVHQAAEIAKAIPNARLQVLGRGGHGMLGEYGDDVIRAMRRFLDPA